MQRRKKKDTGTIETKGMKMIWKELIIIVQQNQRPTIRIPGNSPGLFSSQFTNTQSTRKVKNYTSSGNPRRRFNIFHNFNYRKINLYL